MESKEGYSLEDYIITNFIKSEQEVIYDFTRRSIGNESTTNDTYDSDQLKNNDMSNTNNQESIEL